ncbi:GNAT family acetyltransferase [Promicromonospora iranensis]|uniref:Ribosomal protein S18 acetylase RimI-like enzyme n=1 Tax=Promicromonospora iranensis TaxID=1105144 RepID=A0ABU2CMF5_9MICO|nr:GNAT family acetyltransferase [Promicromonospora iranensis]MDR7382503.1 ribosomal protein S18 acetylase RimI-like enzyme [Promicromonospora iranensis]
MSAVSEDEQLAPVLAAAPAADGEFVEITDADVEQVVELWKTCGLTRPWNDPYVDIADARAGEGSTVLAARAGGRVAATAMAGHDGHRGWLYYVAVAPELRSTGLGRAAVVAAEAWLVARGARKIQLMVRTANTDVLDFYGRLGYTDQECTVLGRWVESD